MEQPLQIIRRKALLGAAGMATAAIARSARAEDVSPVVLGSFGGVFESALDGLKSAMSATAKVDLQISVGSSQIILSKLMAGQNRSPFDAVMMTAEAMLMAAQRQLLRPITAADVPAIANLQPRLLAPFAIDGGYSTVPLHWKVMGILWHKDLVPFEITSWHDLWRPELRNRVSLQNMPTLGGATTLITAAIINGGSQKDLEPGWKAMAALRPNIRDFYAVSSNALASLASGDTWACVNVVDLGLPMASRGVVATVPKEGVGYSPEGMAVPRYGRDPAGAFRLIDFMLQPQQQLAWARAAKVAPSTNVAVPPDLAKDVIETPAVLSKLLNIDFLDMGLNMQKWSERWRQDVVQ